MSSFSHDGADDDGMVGSTASHDHNGVVGRNEDRSPRKAARPQGNGVFGTTRVPDGAGVFGLHEDNGVGVAGFGHPEGIGVAGISAPEGRKGGDGVLGVSNSEHRNGVVGRNDATVARGTAAPGGNGLFGFTQVPDGSGVFGMHGGLGIGVAGLGLIGVSGGSANGVGVMGVSTPAGGVGAGDGVQGITNSAQRNGIYGLNQAQGARDSDDPAGNGVLGYSSVSDGCGVMGAHGAGGHGVFGQGGFGVTGSGSVMGVWGIAKGSGWAGYFTGPVRVDGTLSLGEVEIEGHARVEGDLRVRGDIELPDRDIAERFAVAIEAECAPGTVMVIGEAGALEPCARAYDKRAVGVVAGAGTLRTAITLGAGAQGEGAPQASIALVGTAFCQVDADFGAIEAGDLITTSTTPGHGMQAADVALRGGCVIGKALAALPRGRGLIPILLALG